MNLKKDAVAIAYWELVILVAWYTTMCSPLMLEWEVVSFQVLSKSPAPAFSKL